MAATQKLDSNRYYSTRFKDATNYKYTGEFFFEDDTVFFIAIDADGNEYETADEPEYLIDLTRNKETTQFEMKLRTNNIAIPNGEFYKVLNFTAFNAMVAALSIHQLMSVKLTYERGDAHSPDVTRILEVINTYYEKRAEELRGKLYRLTNGRGYIDILSGKAQRFLRKDLMAWILGERIPIAKCGISALEDAVLYVAGLSERQFEISKYRDEAIRDWIKQYDTSVHAHNA